MRASWVVLGASWPYLKLLSAMVFCCTANCDLNGFAEVMVGTFDGKWVAEGSCSVFEALDLVVILPKTPQSFRNKRIELDELDV